MSHFYQANFLKSSHSKMQKSWQDLSQTKKKKSEQIKHARGTGGGPPLPPELDITDELILSTIAPTAITDHDKDSDSDTFLKNCIEELKHEIIQKNNTIENMKIEYNKFYEAAIEMERDLTNKILQQKQTTEILESKIKTLTNSKVADKTEELVFASTQTDEIMEQQQQKQIEIKMTHDRFSQTESSLDNHSALLPNIHLSMRNEK
ncbi:hypothetical protein JTB14_020950 [Gonioctena quinquepunctata]|nr:hypothetical protein JTB14_020950 [Gonioctena quinquepunctata]